MPDPTHQIRIIGPRDWANQLLYHLTYTVKAQLGPKTRITRQVRAARRVGHVHAYLTITPAKEDNPDG